MNSLALCLTPEPEAANGRSRDARPAVADSASSSPGRQERDPEEDAQPARAQPDPAWRATLRTGAGTGSLRRCFRQLSDTFEYRAYEVVQGRHFVLRAKENRRLAEPIGKAELIREKSYLFDTVRAVEPADQRTLKVASPGRKARTTQVQVAFAPVRIAPPGKKSGDYAHEPLDLWAVRVWEPNTPADESPLEWILLSNCPVRTLPDAFERINWYELRWIIEEYHKGMKTGCGIETLQFDTLEAVEPAIALISAVATTLLRLRDAAAPDADCRLATEVVDRVYVEALASCDPGRSQEQCHGVEVLHACGSPRWSSKPQGRWVPGQPSRCGVVGPNSNPS